MISSLCKHISCFIVQRNILLSFFTKSNIYIAIRPFLATSIKSNTRIAITVVVEVLEHVQAQGLNRKKPFEKKGFTKTLAPEGYRESFAEFAGALSCSRHSKQRHFISYIKQPRHSASEIQNVRFGIAATLIDKTRVCSLTFQRLLAVDQTK